MHFAIWDPFLTISRVWELLFCVWDPFYSFILLLCQLFCHFAGLRARFCVHRPESTVCNIMFAETKVSMKQRRMRMLTCSGRICSMRTRLHGIAAISILRPALISNIIRNTLGKFMWKCRWNIRLRKMWAFLLVECLHRIPCLFHVWTIQRGHVRHTGDNGRTF